MKITGLFLIACFALLDAVYGVELSAADVGIITDARFYSAGKMTGKEIDEFYRAELPPDKFDMWHDKKPRMYLHGAWKFVKLSNTRFLPESDYGVKNGFAEPDFDDSAWFHQPVPYQWNMILEPDIKKVPPLSPKEIREFWLGGIGWYRKEIRLPEEFQGRRVILHCETIDHDAVIYVNGQKIGEHRNLQRNSSGYNQKHFLASANSFELDITDSLKPDAENTLAVRVYDDGIVLRHKNAPGWGGIWQEIFLEARPAVNLTRALITPRLAQSDIVARCFIDNTMGRETEVELTAVIKPWRSERYKLADAGGKEPFKHPVGSFALKPGVNEMELVVPLDHPVQWTTEYPFLYHFEVVDSNGAVLGQERFGYRDFKVGKHLFKLNGVDVMLRGIQVEDFKFNFALCNFNRADEMWKYFSIMKQSHYNLCRPHSTLMPQCVYQMGDELGLMFSDEFPQPYDNESSKEYLLELYGNTSRLNWMTNVYDFQSGELTPRMRESIRNRLFKLYNHPCVVIRDGGNEIWDGRLDSDVFRQKYGFTSFTPYLDKVVAAFREYDPTRPVAPCSGRAPTDESLAKVGSDLWNQARGKPADGDYYDIHKYSWYPPLEVDDDPSLRTSFKKIYEAYALDAGMPRAVMNGEVGGTVIPIAGHGWDPRYDKYFAGHHSGGKFDKQWFVDTFGASVHGKIPGYSGYTSRLECFFIELATFAGRRQANAVHIKRLFELYRRQRQWIAGFADCYTRLFELAFGGRIPNRESGQNRLQINQPAADYITAALQPLLACFDGKLNRNLVAGRQYEEIVYVMNDTLNDVVDVTVRISMEKDGASVWSSPEITVGALKPAEMRTYPLQIKLPETIKTDHYRMTLKVFASGVEKSSNWANYDFYALNPADIRVKTTDAAVLFTPVTSPDSAAVRHCSDVFAQLGIDCAQLDDLNKIEGDKILFMPPHSWKDGLAGESFMQWLENGGRVVCLEQDNMPFDISGRIAQCRRTGGFRTEMLNPDYPLFKGLARYDFFMWNGRRTEDIMDKWFVSSAIVPLSGAGQSVIQLNNYKLGSGIAEMRIGKGLCLISQLEALNRFGTDSVATKYLINLFEYVLNDWSGDHAAETQLAGDDASAKKLEFMRDKAFFVDLKPYVNMGFKDEAARDGKGGWTDQGPIKDMRNIPTGTISIKGVDFEIINPEENNGKSCVVLAGPIQSRTDFLPRSVKNIKIGRQLKKLFLLVSGAYVPKSEVKVADLEFIYGESVGAAQVLFTSQTLDLISGKNIYDWSIEKELPEAVSGWIGPQGSEGMNECATYSIEWVNPEPERIIQSVNFNSTGMGVPILLAITGESFD